MSGWLPSLSLMRRCFIIKTISVQEVVTAYPSNIVAFYMLKTVDFYNTLDYKKIPLQRRCMVIQVECICPNYRK